MVLNTELENGGGAADLGGKFMNSCWVLGAIPEEKSS